GRGARPLRRHRAAEEPGALAAHAPSMGCADGGRGLWALAGSSLATADVNSPAPKRRDERLWTTGAKQGVGTAPGRAAPVWFTIADGAITELYYPRNDVANTRDLRFIVTDDGGFVS